jgi:hypothetical protein
MPQNIFKIYDGRTNFWQWDVKQKLIVLDDRITEVHFSNRNMSHSIKRDIYIKDGLRLCNVPSDLLKLPRNLVAYAYVDGATVKSVKFAVIKRPMPSDYISDQNEEIEDKFTQIDIMLEALNDNKADDIQYDEEGKYIQLLANGEPIGTRIEIIKEEAPGIENCEVNEEGHLIVTLTNGKTIDAGYVGSVDGAVFTPHVSENKILTWTCSQDLPLPDPVDLNPFDEWIELGDDGEVDSQYVWEVL